jgi:hypothetical protein
MVSGERPVLLGWVPGGPDNLSSYWKYFGGQHAGRIDFGIQFWLDKNIGGAK